MDFATLFDVAPNAYMVLDAELRYVAANATYLELTASTLEQLLGRNIFELFPNDPADPNNLPARMLRGSLERVLATGERDHLALIPYRVPKKTESGAAVAEERYWSATHTPIRDASGKVALILQHTVDVTELQRLRQDAEARGGTDLSEETGVLLRARAVQDEKLRSDAERERLRFLFEQAPGFIAVLDGPEHVIELANAAYRRLVGDRELVGKPVREALPEVVAQGFIQLLDRVYTSGEPFLGQGLSVVLERTAGRGGEERFVDFIYQPIRGEDGAVRGIFVQGHDVTDRVLAEREREDARRAAEAFASELVAQSAEVKAALERAHHRIRELEARLATT